MSPAMIPLAGLTGCLVGALLALDAEEQPTKARLYTAALMVGLLSLTAVTIFG